MGSTPEQLRLYAAKYHASEKGKETVRIYRSKNKARLLEFHRAQMAAWRRANPEAHAEYVKKYAAKNGDAMRAWRLADNKKNKDRNRARAKRYVALNRSEISRKRSEHGKLNRGKLRIYLREWSRLNPEKAAAQRKRWRTSEHGRAHVNRMAQEREILKNHALPKWADRKKISNFYLQASRTGLSVDHIIPIKHHLVCGLHVETNLQLLSKSENSRKRNHFTPYGVSFQ